MQRPLAAPQGVAGRGLARVSASIPLSSQRANSCAGDHLHWFCGPCTTSSMALHDVTGRHGTRLVATASASPACIIGTASGAVESPNAQAAGVLAALRRHAAPYTALAVAAAWCFLANGGGPALASMTVSMPQGAGSELAVRSAWTGLATGVFHTLCGPDHLAGLAPLSIGRGRLAACGLGALWGFGHSTGQFILGIMFALLKDRFHDFMPALDTWASYIVPMTLIFIGLLGIYEAYFAGDGSHAHAPVVDASGGAMSLAMPGAGAGSATAPVPPSTARSTDAGATESRSKRAGLTTYVTGIVHGLQPDALYVVIPALALPTKLAAVAFIGMFVIGTVVSMGGYTLMIGATSKTLIKEQPWLQSHLSTIACGFAILCGVLMLLAAQGVSVPIFS